MKFFVLPGLLLVTLLTACGSGSSPLVPTATIAPTDNATIAAPTAVPPTPTVVPVTDAPATGIPAPTATALPLAPEPTDTPTATPTATIAPTAVRPRPTATSSGPLAAMIYVANCHSAPSADKPGRVMVQISIEASGGNGQYRYFYQDKEFPTKFIDVIGEKGTRSIGEVRVTSGDGQEFKKEFDIGIGGLSCP